MSLIVTIDSIVENDNLRKINEASIHVGPDVPFTGNKSVVFSLGWSKSIKGRIAGDGYFTSIDGTENKGKNLNPCVAYTCVNLDTTFNLFLSDKANITKIDSQSGGWKVNVSEFDYSGLKILLAGAGSVYGNLDDCPNFCSRVTQLKVRDGVNSLYGDLSSFTNESMTICDISRTSIVGDLSSLAKLTALTQLYIKDTEITGSFDDLADAQFDNGRTSGTMTTLSVDSSTSVAYTFTSSGWTKA